MTAFSAPTWSVELGVGSSSYRRRLACQCGTASARTAAAGVLHRSSHAVDEDAFRVFTGRDLRINVGRMVDPDVAEQRATGCQLDVPTEVEQLLEHGRRLIATVEEDRCRTSYLTTIISTQPRRACGRP
jgi:hypothetical protein